MKRLITTHTLRFGVFLLLFTALVAIGERSSPQEGTINLDELRKAKIAELAPLLESNTDMAAEKQVVLLQWLIELFDSTSNIEGMKRGYDKILSFYPYDVGTLNRYAQLYIEKEKNYTAAESLLADAITYARLIEAFDVERGTTQRLLASIRLETGDIDEAIDHLKQALHLYTYEPTLKERTQEDLIRIFSRAGMYDDVVNAYLDLIALTGVANQAYTEEIANYIAISDNMQGENAVDLIRDALDRGMNQRKKAIESEGGEWMRLLSSDEFPLEGTYYKGTKPGAILFLPDVERTRSGYRIAAQLFFSEGIHSLAIDFRGRGGSRSRHVSHIQRNDISRLTDDAWAAFDTLQERTFLPNHRIVVIAEGSACQIAEFMIYQHAIDSPVIYLSPQFREDDREIYNAIAFHPDRPLLFVDSMEDRTSHTSISFFKGVKSFDRLEYLTLKNAGHGTQILTRSDKALTAIVSWLNKTLDLN